MKPIEWFALSGVVALAYVLAYGRPASAPIQAAPTVMVQPSPPITVVVVNMPTSMPAKPTVMVAALPSTPMPQLNPVQISNPPPIPTHLAKIGGAVPHHMIHCVDDKGNSVAAFQLSEMAGYTVGDTSTEGWAHVRK